MKQRKTSWSTLIFGWVIIISIATTSAALASDKVVIAHRGASGYLPEHTIAAKVMAYAMGADYIEQDIVMTMDNQLVVLHDHHLDQVTNVQETFPGRQRSDGRYYVIDFTLEEIQSLRVTERYNIASHGKKAIFADRFPINKSRFSVHTLAEEIELIQGLNKSTGGNVGIYPEIKSPQFHLDEGKDISEAVLKTLKAYGYTDKTDKVFLQTFDYSDLKRIHDTLMPALGMQVKLVQLMENNKAYQWMVAEGGIDTVAKYADGIGPDINLIVSPFSKPEFLFTSSLVANAHAAGLAVHPYTFRKDSIAMPAYAESFDILLDIFFNQVGVDGVFTDFPDKAAIFLHNTPE
jgi:glycerophosphoryl diester phosphodiesterase